MQNIYFLSFELITLGTFALCLVHAWRAGSKAVWQLLAGVVFGLLLELATIRQLHAYQYGKFLLMVLDVPLEIGIAWGSMIYSVRGFTDATNLPPWARPVLDALLVLNLDLAIDALAIRLGFWNWGQGLQSQYFGVPYANFWAWFWVVFSFSAGLRLFGRIPGRWGGWLAPAGAILAGIVGVLVTNALIVYWVPRALYEITVAGVLFGALVLVLAQRPRLTQRPGPLAGQVSLITHAYFLAVGLISGVILQPAVLLAVSLLMTGIALYVYHARFTH